MPHTPDAILDAWLDVIADNADEQELCSSEPANFAGISAVALGTATLTAGVGNGDYTRADGDTSGRKITVGAQNVASASAGGSVNSLALNNGTDTLYHAGDGDGTSISMGGEVDTGAWDIEIEDPT